MILVSIEIKKNVDQRSHSWPNKWEAPPSRPISPRTWSERYSEAPVIQRYLAYVADRLHLRREITLNTRVESANFDEAANVWQMCKGDRNGGRLIERDQAPDGHMVEERKPRGIRLYRGRCRIGRLCGGQSVERKSGQTGSVDRGGRRRPPLAQPAAVHAQQHDSHPRRVPLHHRCASGELELHVRTGREHGGGVCPISSRTRAGRIVLDQRYALCSRAVCRLRSLGADGLHRVELGGCPALVPPRRRSCAGRRSCAWCGRPAQRD